MLELVGIGSNGQRVESASLGIHTRTSMEVSRSEYRCIRREGSFGRGWWWLRRWGWRYFGGSGSFAHLGSDLRRMTLGKPSNLLEKEVDGDLKLGCSVEGSHVSVFGARNNKVMDVV